MTSAPTLVAALAWVPILFASAASAQQQDPVPAQRPLLQEKRAPPAIQPRTSEHLRRALLDPMRPVTEQPEPPAVLATPLRKRAPALVFVGSADVPAQATTAFSPVRTRTSALVAVGNAELPGAGNPAAFVPVRKRTSALAFIGMP
jgi:hypothetical protein